MCVCASVSVCFSVIVLFVFMCVCGGDGGAETSEGGHSEGHSDGQAIYEVMHRIAQCDHPGHRLYVCDPLATQPMTGNNSFLHARTHRPTNIISIIVKLKCTEYWTTESV